MAALGGGIARIKVGAATETELKDKKLRYEDALNAVKSAMEMEGACSAAATPSSLSPPPPLFPSVLPGYTLSLLYSFRVCLGL